MDRPCSICGGHHVVMAVVTVTVDAPPPVGVVKWHEWVCLGCQLERERQVAHDAEQERLAMDRQATAPAPRQPKTRAGAHG